MKGRCGRVKQKERVCKKCFFFKKGCEKKHNTLSSGTGVPFRVSKNLACNGQFTADGKGHSSLEPN